MHVLIGVDPHQHSHTTAAVDQRGELLAPQRFPASPQGHRALRRFAKGWPQRRWAIEGAAGVGRVLAQQLVANGDQVTDVPAKPAARVRELSVGHGRTHDTGDAVPIAQRRPGPASACPRSTSKARPGCCGRCRTGAMTWWPRAPRPCTGCTGRPAELVAAGADRRLTAETAAGLLRRVRPTSPAVKARRQLAVDPVRDVHALQSAHRPGPGAPPGGRPGVQHHAGRTVRRRPGAGRQGPGRGRRRRPVSHQGPVRRPHRHRADRGLPAARSSATASRGPATAGSTTPCT
jgi:Transposase